MGNLKGFSGLTVASVFFVLAFSNSIAPNQTKLLPNEFKLNQNSKCSLSMIPLEYEINIGPIKNSSDHVRVSCWVKITAKIGENDCRSPSNTTDTFISLNSRNCKPILKNLTVWRSNTMEPITMLGIKMVSVENDFSSEIFYEVPYRYEIQLDKNQVNIGDQILLDVPYEIELTRTNSEEFLQGFYYYDPSYINGTSLWNYFPLHAKYMFPIVDNDDPFHQPAFKISVARYVPDGFVSISNTDIVDTTESTNLGKGWVTDHFRKSPPIKMRQVALLVLGGFQNFTIYSENVNSTGLNRTINLWALENGGYPNDCIYHTLFGVQSLMDYYDRLFMGTEYPLNKIDFILVPWGYSTSFNEANNLGIMINGQSGLLDGRLELGEYQENGYTERFMAIEIALQWFDGITLPINEYSEFIISGQTLALYLNTYVFNYTRERTLSRNGYHEMDLVALLDLVEYVVSREVLQYAICQIYLSKTVAKETFPTSLWSAIQQSLEYHNKTALLPDTGENRTVSVAEIMSSWINKTDKYPSIFINAVENFTDSIKLFQEFPKEADKTFESLWWVPVNITTGNGHALIWISPNNTSINTSIIYRNSDIIDTENGYLFVSPNLTDFYEVQYDKHLLKNVAKQLNLNHLIIPKDLIKNQFNFLWLSNEWETLEMTLEMTKYLGKEMDESVWNYVIGGMISRFHGKFVKQPSSYQVYFGQRISDVLRKIGLSPNIGEHSSIAKLRRILMEVSHLFEVPILIEHGTDGMKQWIENSTVNPFNNKAGPEFHQAFYCAAIKGSVNGSVFNFLYNQLVNFNFSDNSNDKWDEAKRICKALTCVKDDNAVVSLLRNDSSLAIMEHKVLQTCYQQLIPFEILCMRPLTMKQAAFDFWMRFDLKETQTNINETEENKIVIPWSHEIKTSFEYSRIGNLEDQVKFVSKYTLEGDPVPTMSITLRPNKIDFTSNELMNKSEKWFDENL